MDESFWSNKEFSPLTCLVFCIMHLLNQLILSSQSSLSGPIWLKNLYTTYLLVLRAVTKAKPYWEKETFYTGDEIEDKMVKNLVLDIVKSTQYVLLNIISIIIIINKEWTSSDLLLY